MSLLLSVVPPADAALLAAQHVRTVIENIEERLSEGRRSEDLPLVQWVLETALTNIQTAREGIHQNLRLPGVGNALGKALGLYARLNRFGAAPSDRVTHQAAQTLMQPGEQRDRLTGNAYVPSDPASALGRLEHALDLCTRAAPLLKKLKDAVMSSGKSLLLNPTMQLTLS